MLVSDDLPRLRRGPLGGVSDRILATKHFRSSCFCGNVKFSKDGHFRAIKLWLAVLERAMRLVHPQKTLITAVAGIDPFCLDGLISLGGRMAAAYLIKLKL